MGPGRARALLVASLISIPDISYDPWALPDVSAEPGITPCASLDVGKKKENKQTQNKTICSLEM